MYKATKIYFRIFQIGKQLVKKENLGDCQERNYQVSSPRLTPKVTAIAVKTLNMYLNDPEIIARYNLAFERGWKSQAY